MKKRKQKEKEKAKVHEELRGFELSVDQFGEIKSNVQIDRINEFLDQNVEDKKLANRKENRKKPARKKG